MGAGSHLSRSVFLTLFPGDPLSVLAALVPCSHSLGVSVTLVLPHRSMVTSAALPWLFRRDTSGDRKRRAVNVCGVGVLAARIADGDLDMSTVGLCADVGCGGVDPNWPAGACAHSKIGCPPLSGQSDYSRQQSRRQEHRR
jgi:hypothetical protein